MGTTRDNWAAVQAAAIAVQQDETEALSLNGETLAFRLPPPCRAAGSLAFGQLRCAGPDAIAGNDAACSQPRNGFVQHNTLDGMACNSVKILCRTADGSRN